jgi:hypothetical protein
MAAVSEDDRVVRVPRFVDLASEVVTSFHRLAQPALLVNRINRNQGVAIVDEPVDGALLDYQALLLRLEGLVLARLARVAIIQPVVQTECGDVERARRGSDVDGISTWIRCSIACQTALPIREHELAATAAEKGSLSVIMPNPHRGSVANPGFLRSRE